VREVPDRDTLNGFAADRRSSGVTAWAAQVNNAAPLDAV